MEPLGTEQPVLSGDESAVRVESRFTLFCCIIESEGVVVYYFFH